MLLRFPEILMIILIFQLIFISFYLLTRQKGNKLSNVLLGLFFLCLGLSMADNFLITTGVGYQYTGLVIWTSALPLVYGPLLYLYTNSLLLNKFKFKPILLLHFLPFALFFTASVVGYNIQPQNFKLNMLHTINSHKIAPQFYLFAVLIFGHFITYAVSCLKIIKKFMAAALNRCSDARQFNLQWLTNTIRFFIVLFLISIVNNVLQAEAVSSLYNITVLLIISGLLVFINQVLFKALKNPELFSWVNEPNEFKVIVNTNGNRDAELALLNSYMADHKPYLNASLTVEGLAKAIRMRPNELSKIINENLGQNFFDFVNKYRINEAKLLLENPEDPKITVLEILYRVGFNSKSSFNTLFKKYTGFTPTEFKNRAQR